MSIFLTGFSLACSWVGDLISLVVFNVGLRVNSSEDFSPQI
jgi:hypothetical protein